VASVSTLQQFENALDIALQAQGYRPVSMSSLGDDGGVHLPGPTDPAEVSLDSALRGAVATGNWGEIGRQIAQFKHSPGFRSVYVRRDRNAFRPVVVQAWTRLTLSAAESEFRRAWIPFKELGKRVPNYQLPNKAAIEQLLNQFSGPLVPGPNPEGLGGNADPAQASDGILALRRAEQNPAAKGKTETGNPTSALLALTASLLRLAISIAESSGAAIGNVVMIAVDGLPADLVAKLEGIMGMHHQDIGAMIHARELFAVGVDQPLAKVHGHTAGLDLGDLGFILRKELQDIGIAVP
jgi:hypothetical protein